MCEQCHQIMNTLTPEMKDVLEQVRPKMEALAAEVGAIMKDVFFNYEINPDTPQERKDFINSIKEKHIEGLCLNFAAGYYTASMQHDHELVLDLDHTYSAGSNVGWAKGHIDMEKAALN